MPGGRGSVGHAAVGAARARCPAGRRGGRGVRGRRLAGRHRSVLRRCRVAGGQGIRFCYYNLDERFQGSPMMIDSEESLEGLRAALTATPKLRALIKKLGL